MAVSGTTTVHNELYECAICLQPLSNPKTLNCNHTYCKVCLDYIITFIDEEGYAIIRCPLRCEALTEIMVDETTNDLPTRTDAAYLPRLLSIDLDQTEQPVDENLLCSESDECKNKVEFYCKPCSQMLCSDCQAEHIEKQSEKHRENEDKSKTFIPVAVDEKNDTVMVVCQEHGTLANMICGDCEGQFICIYCRHREHRDHYRCETVTESADRIRMMIKNPRAVMEADIARARHLFEVALRQRRMKCIIQYIEHLNREEDEITHAFNDMLGLENSDGT